MLGSKLKEWPAGKPIRLDNCTCVYCDASLDMERRTEEHVVGRKFVPKGKLEGQWNLILWACESCNRHKADLEDDLSAITMQPDSSGAFAVNDPTLAAEARRKGAGARSRSTKRRVQDSYANIKFTAPFAASFEASFDLTGPPQVDLKRAIELARLHTMAFFYWITFNTNAKRGRCPPGGFYLVLEATRADWGNPIHRAFMDAVVGWEPRVLGIGADAFFKIVIRRHPAAECWSWATEWNQNFRMVGFFGDLAAAKVVAGTFPPLAAKSFLEAPGRFIRYRVETPISDADDKLFDWDDPQTAAPSSPEASAA